MMLNVVCLASHFKRQQPKTLRLGKADGKAIILHQLHPYAEQILRATTWASRAWTYHEGFLSPRRLIFTKEQVLFLCNSMWLAESVAFPIEADYLQLQEVDNFKRLLRSDQYLLSRERSFLPVERMGGLRDHIYEYSRRTLRYEEDSLNAFLGVLNSHASSALKSQPLWHIWGIPFVIYNETQCQQWNSQAPSCAEFPFFWMHEKPARRRNGFPSWSWTGWAGQVNFPAWSITLRSEQPSELE